MSHNGASFLPRLESVFYAVFDVEQGPKIVSQVPEALIATTTSSGHASGASSSTLFAASPASSTPSLPDVDLPSRAASSSTLASPLSQRLEARGMVSPDKRGNSVNRFLFQFDDISKYVIPSKALCGRLVICATRNHQILGFPVRLDDDSYPRNYFLYNLCFVFERIADLSCYEPVARKVSRVLTACEKESGFLSSPGSAPAVHAILEQLYEDLNSYSETSIPIDPFNSIELKIFPFYPNPPPVKDWLVPLALINLTNRIEPNWDLTIVKICPFIDGINHVSRIARLANCDPNLTRLAISHLLYYQVIMMIDIFQYSNMYTLRKSMQWLADKDHIRDECGPYVTKPGSPIPDWPTLLHLYSRFRAGKTVRDWMEEYEVHKLNLDVRRFTSFGVIKGFLRRVHRWPVLLSTPEQAQDRRPSMASLGRKRGKSFASAMTISTTTASPPTTRTDPESLRSRGRVQEAQPTIASAGAEILPASSTPSLPTTLARTAPARRASAAESSLEMLRNRDGRKPLQDRAYQTMSRLYGRTETMAQDAAGKQGDTLSRRMTRNAVSSSPDAFEKRGLSTTVGGMTSDTLDSEQSSGGRSNLLGTARPRIPRELSTTNHGLLQGPAQFPPELLTMLDGEHHTDEICTRFEVGWPMLRQWLFAAGGAQEGDDDYGNISIIYR
ncbi:NPR2-domain-containing protein [Lentinus tigrinus ALCF2SS1-7]|uniref:NPR2-domain-containing protein n=1 Tax=Lentinus tigrinus ALCF2SS1-6 TaxID=1328759 RepID=A0A5C2SRR8_9APHY|nr:NPR2-domain-containing protein [Lentinus tigrinus ALCF2SS1-6]RPD80291.1 NPR2-domain-containing protein [Lentinus tigrinus ALCF2SS1-7]